METVFFYQFWSFICLIKTTLRLEMKCSHHCALKLYELLVWILPKHLFSCWLCQFAVLINTFAKKLGFICRLRWDLLLQCMFLILHFQFTRFWLCTTFNNYCLDSFKYIFNKCVGNKKCKLYRHKRKLVYLQHCAKVLSHPSVLYILLGKIGIGSMRCVQTCM